MNFNRPEYKETNPPLYELFQEYQKLEKEWKQTQEEMVDLQSRRSETKFKPTTGVLMF